MDKYHKIQTMFKRDMANKGEIIVGKWTIPELEFLKDNQWVFTEKVDGTNIRVGFDGTKLQYGGRTDNAQIPFDLVKKLQEIFEPKLSQIKEKFPSNQGQEEEFVCFFGEGYGAGIQKGGNYKQTKDFVLFDIKIGKLWLRREDVENIAKHLGLDIVPVVGRGTIQDAIDLVKGGLKSTWGDFMAEGIVLRPATELRTRRGDRMITKIKHKDFIRKD